MVISSDGWRITKRLKKEKIDDKKWRRTRGWRDGLQEETGDDFSSSLLVELN